MRLLKIDEQGGLSLTRDLHDDIPPYAILSHTWGADDDEIDYEEFIRGPDQSKRGYDKIRFCKEQAVKDRLEYFWIDTCCINKANHTELSTAISSMFRWYRDAQKCYVYLPDVDTICNDEGRTTHSWEGTFRTSQWFKRGWTLQELLAPSTVEFYSRQGQLLGSKKSLERLVHEITTIPVYALRDGRFSDFPDEERMRWTEGRLTKLPQDKVYCLLGIFGVSIPLNYGEEEDLVWRRFREEIAKRTDPSPSTNHTHWLVKRPLNPLFVGREDVLRDLQAAVRDAVFNRAPHEECRIVITGMGGQGKSELCLQLAQSLRQITTSSAEKSFLDTARSLGLPATHWEDACLRLSNLKEPWLLVLDNADNPEVDYQHYFPSGPLGVTILTSRVPECRAYATTRQIALEELPREQAQELILKAAGLPTSKYELYGTEATAIVELLGSHTLALIQAGTYVARGHCKLAQYPAILHQRPHRLLEFRPKQGRSRYEHVYATFEASAEILEQNQSEEARDALQLLPLLAACDPNRIPLRVFESCWKRAREVSRYQRDNEEVDVLLTRMMPWHVAHLPPFIDIDKREAWDAFRLMEAVHQLESLALISVHRGHDDMWLSMHPLIHAWARDRQNRTQQHSSWLQMACVVAFSLTEDIYDDENIRKLHHCQLPSHIKALASWDGEIIAFQKVDLEIVKNEMLGLYYLAGLSLLNRGRARVAAEILEQVVRINEERLAEADYNRISFQIRLVIAYKATGRVKKALELYKRNVKTKEQTLPEDHLRLLSSQYDLAMAYNVNGQVEKSLKLFQYIVKIEQKTLTKNHPALLRSQYGLALAYLANGHVKESIKLFQCVLKSGEQALPEDHPDRLASQHSLALAYKNAGQLKESMEVFRNVVRVSERTLDETSRSRLYSEANLASLLWDFGDREKAIDMMVRTVNNLRKAFDDDHPVREKYEARLSCWKDEMKDDSTHTEMDLPVTDSSSAEGSTRNEAGGMSKRRRLNSSLEAGKQ